ncbi:MAG: gliding motility-associated C-terminal domain-containing protein [Crocinitomicaceae bacterium]|nr:gliding motility-associated C-terminal domain-containing protein [Crocinitomicaceae bacterium]
MMRFLQKIAWLYSALFSFAAFAHEVEPLHLVENKGQWPEKVLFATDVPNGKLFFENDGLTFHLFDLSALSAAHGHNGEKIVAPRKGDVRIRGHIFHVAYSGANRNAYCLPVEKQKEYFNFFLGNKEENWAGGCRAYGRFSRHGLYHGIDQVFYSVNDQLKCDYIVHPSGNPSSLRLKYEYADKVWVENGRLKIITGVGEVWEEIPETWQMINGKKVSVTCEFRLINGEVTFYFPNGYDRSADLVIDPALVFSTYSGSYSDNFGYTATYDSQGYLYSGSSAFGQGYPTTVGAYQTVWGGGDGSFGLPGTDMAITKYDVSGTFRVWSTFLGGQNDELPHSLICNALDELLVYGTTSSPNFPSTLSAYDHVFNGGTPFSPQGVGTDYVNGSDIVVTRLNFAATNIINSTFIGGNSNDGVNTASALKYNYADEFRGEIDIDSQGNIVIASSTFSPDFPIVNPVQSVIGGAQDACLVKLNADLSSILWSTFLGGTNDDSGYSACFDDQDNIYICGGTKSQNFPSTSNVLSSLHNGGSADGWVALVSSDGGTLLRSTYFGSNQYDQLYFVETDDENQVYVYGQTRAPGSTFVINAAWSQTNSGMVVSKLTSTLDQITWSTVFGTGSGKPNLSPAAFLVDVCGKIYLSGWGGTTNTSSNPAGTDNTFNLVTTPNAFQTTTNGSDFYLLVLEADASNLVYASFFGGAISAEHVDGGTSRFDRKGVIYQSVCAGCGNHDDFPIFPANAVSATNNSSNCNNGVFKYDFELPLTIANFSAPPVGCINQPVTFNSTSTFAQTFAWNFGDGETSPNPNPVHSFENTGEYAVTLIVTNNLTCNGADTLQRIIQISEPEEGSLTDIEACAGEPVTIGTVNSNPTYTYSWSPSVYLSDSTDPNPSFTGGESTFYTLLIQHGGCTDTWHQQVNVHSVSLLPIADTILCEQQTLTFTAFPIPPNAGITWSSDPLFNNIINDGSEDHDVSVNVTNPMTLYVMANSNGCSVEEEVVITLVGFQTEIEGDFTACVNDTVQLNVLSPNSSFTYTWEPTDLIISGQNTPEVTVVVPGQTTFIVTSHTPFGCSAEDGVVVEVSSLTSGALTATATPEWIIEGQSSQLMVEPNGLNYQWSPSSTLDNPFSQHPVATPNETTVYYVTVSDGECHTQISVTVRVADFVCGPPAIYVPNAFTPNKDGKNEKLFVRGNNISKLYFVIYDRWGEKMFETESLHNGWDGMFKGREVDPDVYVYYIEANCIGGETYFDKGNITVIR